MRNQALKSLLNWANIPNAHALSLLQHEISDSVVRKFAVDKLSKCSNRLLANYMPQLVQALKFEAHHYSELGQMLLTRSLKSPRIVGHAYFWALNASLYDLYSFERLYLHYERLLFLGPHFRNDLYLQSQVNDEIIHTNHLASTKEGMTDKDLMNLLNLQLRAVKEKLKYPYFVLPHIPHIPLKSIVKLKTLASKQKPLYLICEIGQAEEEKKEGGDDEEEEKQYTKENSIESLFKKGDDLRKDQIVIQCFKIFDQLCLEESLDLNITDYTVLATGFKFGYIEFVGNKEDLVKIHKIHSSFWDCLFENSLINNLKSILKKKRELEKTPIHSKFLYN